MHWKDEEENKGNHYMLRIRVHGEKNKKTILRNNDTRFEMNLE